MEGRQFLAAFEAAAACPLAAFPHAARAQEARTRSVRARRTEAIMADPTAAAMAEIATPRQKLAAKSKIARLLMTSVRNGQIGSFDLPLQSSPAATSSWPSASWFCQRVSLTRGITKAHAAARSRATVLRSDIWKTFLMNSVVILNWNTTEYLVPICIRCRVGIDACHDNETAFEILARRERLVAHDLSVVFRRKFLRKRQINSPRTNLTSSASSAMLAGSSHPWI